MLLQGLRPVHNTTLNNGLRCIVFTSTLVETQHDTRIDSDPILGFPCTACLRLVVKNPRIFFSNKFVRLTQRKVLRHFVNQPLAYCTCRWGFNSFTYAYQWCLAFRMPNLNFANTEFNACQSYQLYGIYNTIVYMYIIARNIGRK